MTPKPCNHDGSRRARVALGSISRVIFAVAMALATVGSHDAAAAPSVEELISQQVACAAPPSPAAALLDLQRANLIGPKPVWVVNRLSYFKLKRPLMVGGLRVVGVFGHEDRGQGASPGRVFGVVTSSSDALIARWRSRHAEKEIVWDNESDFGPGFARIYCGRAPAAEG